METQEEDNSGKFFSTPHEDQYVKATPNQLIIYIAQGLEGAFYEFYVRYRDAVARRAVGYMHQYDNLQFSIFDVEEWVGDVFIQFLNLLHKYDPTKTKNGDPAIAWLNHLLRYVVLRARNKKLGELANQQKHLAKLLNVKTKTELDHKMLISSIESCLSDKDDDTVKLFVMAFVYKMKQKEIANELDVEPSAIKSRIYRLRQELKTHLMLIQPDLIERFDQ